MKENNAYILGTDTEELHRLGLQHQVWATEAHKGWQLAKFNSGQTILDLGCGPGFCTKELAFIAGDKGKVIGVDKSEHFIKFLNTIKDNYQLNIDAIHSNFDDLNLKNNSIDKLFCRWALAWVPNPKEVLSKIKDALKPGGKIVIHEYYDWSTHKIEPPLPALKKAITEALRSLKDQEGKIDIGRELPGQLNEIGMTVINTRLMAKIASPDSLIWQWPKSFYKSYFPRLVHAGYLHSDDMKAAFKDLEALESNSYSRISCPLMVEVIAEK